MHDVCLMMLSERGRGVLVMIGVEGNLLSAGNKRTRPEKPNDSSAVSIQPSARLSCSSPPDLVPIRLAARRQRRLEIRLGRLDSFLETPN
jgi:hypothetical protein